MNGKQFESDSKINSMKLSHMTDSASEASGTRGSL